MSAGGYRFFMSGIMLPVTPSKLEIKYGNKNKTVTLINGEEINIINPAGLTEMSFEALLPNVRYPESIAVYESGTYISGDIYYDYIKRLKTEQKPFYFSITRTLPNGRVLFYNENFKCTVEDLSVTEEATKGFDLTLKIKLKQYRYYGTVTIKQNSDGSAETVNERPISEEKKEQIPTAESPKTYTVKEGDSLWGICKRVYGDGSRYSDIAQLNGIDNPNVLQIGQVITLD